MIRRWLKLAFGVLCLACNLIRNHSFPVRPTSSLSTKRSLLDDSLRIRPRPDVSASSSKTTTSLFAKLWDRLQIEEDNEPMWYLLNCVAGLEMDLLRQCRQVCQDMPDAIKFVVPTVRKTRSHGANRMVAETKVKYQGYVFAKLRLCEQVYEAIQGLDLCRSWMGTVNRKGYKKLPPAPQALNELEVENFGLEALEDSEEYEESEQEAVEDDGVIVDTAENDAKKKAGEVNEEDLKVYQGLRVEDMVKVTAPGKFYDEDGIVRRLKEGKILVRFYTYGSMYEEWLEPGDVRKLSNIEILKGLSGPSEPVTQRDFDGPRKDRYGRSYDDRRPSDLRRDLRGDIRGRGGTGPPRARRQDRVANRYRQQDRRSDFEQQRREERNWNWYKEQQQKDRDSGGGVSDKEWEVRAGSGPVGDDDWALGDVDSQWGRTSRQPRRDPRKPQRRMRREGVGGGRGEQNDWSAFVSPAADSSQDDASSGEDDKADDFFESLMSDLSKDLRRTKRPSSDSRQPKPPTTDSSDEDEFFASLMSELSDNDEPGSGSSSTSQDKGASLEPTDGDEDFFASLEAELDNVFLQDDDKITDRPSRDDGVDDFVSKLDLERSPDASDYSRSIAVSETIEDSTEASSPSPSSSRSSVQSSSSVKPDQLTKCTVPVLKDMLRERGLKVSGRKAELIERLTS